MHYVRFLKLPKVHVETNNITLRTTVAITTDLGETFYPNDLDLVASVRNAAPDGEIYLRRKFTCPGGSRAFLVAVNLAQSDVEWPACLHIAVKGGAGSCRSTALLSPFIDIWSDELNPTGGNFTASNRVERRFTTLNEKTIALVEDAGDSIARHLWDGSQALAHYVDQCINLQRPGPTELPLLEYVLVSATYRRLNVLELGCGCGTVGISLAQSIPDCDVLLTDLPEASSIANANISRMNPAIASRTAFQPLDWEAPLPSAVATRPYDLIIVSECTYNTSTLKPLVDTLVRLTTQRPKSVVVVATKTRHPDEAQFFDLMKAAGMVMDSKIRVPLAGAAGDGYADWAKDVGIFVFHGRDHRLSLSPRSTSEEETATTSGGAHAGHRSRSR
ncbi:hypothetical protein K431DRAFT_309204 [Polychaeton citri CBS 116435]|uniref:S-adenosyl-L-methionine-dependent methyltransferase n=1 Tax=Polychaeton citri CBS 116435 TaxID=1314669 RepID=A0A9P4UT06_9PEZI|nr:hypothetical protein K431DRAFT_309204 [Polychaeton citri CBS 116435]